MKMTIRDIVQRLPSPALQARQMALDAALVKEAIQFGQFADDMLKQYGLAPVIKAALFRLHGE